ncbi:MAG: mscS 1 [Firmicutes bacterium]|nr:mscS 1 [Bacillota bacterium]
METLVISLPDVKDIILSLGVFLLANTVGIVISKGIWRKLQQIIMHVSEVYAEVIRKALQGMPVLWGALVGSYSAMHIIQIKAAGLQIIDGILIAVGIFSLTMVTARVFAAIAAIYTQKAEGAFPSVSILANIIEVATYVIGILIILQTFGISIAPILTALGVGGLAVALALQDTLSNLFSGLHLLFAKPIQAGDYIKLSTGEEGYVMDISWRNTTIQALGNSMIIVPNQKIASSIITNYDKPNGELAVSVAVGVGYGSNLEHIERETLAVAREVMTQIAPGVKKFDPAVRFHTFGDSSIILNVTLRVQSFIDQYTIKHEFIKRLHHRYQQEGIEFPLSICNAHLKTSESCQKPIHE